MVGTEHAAVSRRRSGAPRAGDGYAMAALLVMIGIMGILMTVAMPVWHQAMQREKEEELIFRGQQYARAIGLFQRKYAGGYPASIDMLVQQKFLRKKYKDPMVEDGQFQLIPAGAMQAGQVGPTMSQTGSTSGRSTFGRSAPQPFGQPSSGATQGSQMSTGLSSQTVIAGGIIGVVSKSKDKSIKLYNGQDHYNQWLFVYNASSGRGAGPGTGRGPGRGGPGSGRGPGGRGGPQGPGQNPRGPGGQ